MVLVPVGEIMHGDVPVVSPCSRVLTAINIMRESGQSGLPVVEGGKLVGIITSRDTRGVNVNRMVADAMTHNPVTIEPKASLWEAKDLLEKHNIERIIVADKNKVLGMVNKATVFMEIGKVTDSLTRLPKAEFIQDKAVELLQKGREISLIFIDIDKFGEVNKTFGHIVGDNVIRQVADIIKELTVREDTYLCRYAGDEFACVCETSNSEASKLADTLISTISNESFCSGVKITASAGVAGGRRKIGQRIKGFENRVVNYLINMASLASTKAKQENRKVVVVESLNIVEAL